MPRRKQRNELLAGTFIVLAVALGVTVLLVLADWRSLLEGRKQLRVIFRNQSIKGLKSGAEVQFRGLPVGKVHTVKLDYGKPREFEVIIEVPRDLELYANASLTIGTGALGGAAWIDIADVGQGDGFVVPAGPPDGFPTACYLSTQPDPNHPLAPSAVPLADLAHPVYGWESPNQLIADVGKTIGFGNEQKTQFQLLLLSLTEAAERMNGMLGRVDVEMLPKVKESLDRIAQLTGVGIELLETINAQTPGLMKGASDTIARLQKLTAEVSPLINDTVARIKAVAVTLDEGTRRQLANVETAMVQINKLLTAAQGSMEDIRQFTGAARDVMVANRDTINDTLSGLRQASEHMAAGMSEIRREPWRLLYSPKPGEERAANLMAAARAYAEGASSLREAATRLSALVSLRGEQLRTDDPAYKALLKDLLASQEKFDKAERALYELLKASK